MRQDDALIWEAFSGESELDRYSGDIDMKPDEIEALVDEFKSTGSIIRGVHPDDFEDALEVAASVASLERMEGSIPSPKGEHSVYIYAIQNGPIGLYILPTPDDDDAIGTGYSKFQLSGL